MARARGGIQAVDVDLREAAALCALDPVASVLAAARIESAIRSGAVRSGSTVWGFERDGRLAAVCWAGANVVPVCHPDDDDALDAFAAAAQRQGRRCSSIVGEAGAVLGLWQRLESAWGPPRDVRPDQPSFVIDSEPWVMPDAAVRVARPDELDLLLPASIQMFVEEVGYSPMVAGPGAYESRVRTLLEEGRTFVRIEEGPDGPEVIFKADLGAVSRQVAQVQGVWVTPRLRGRRISEHGMAAVVQQTVGRVAPVASLYVNSYNAPAMASYRRVGFRAVGRYATVLF